MIAYDNKPDPFDQIFGALILFIIVVAVLFSFVGCQMPPVSELLKGGLDCRAKIVVPDELPRGETVDVGVQIYDCKEMVQGVRLN